MKLLLSSLLYIIGPFLIILLFNRIQLLRKFGTILMAYGLGILLSLFNHFPSSPEEQLALGSLQETLMSLAVPLAIPLMLMSSDFSLWSKSLKKTFSALLGGIVSIMFSIVLAFYLFKDAGIHELWKAGGLLTGLYTGGTLNLVAIGQSLQVDPTIYTLFSTFDMILSFFFLLFIVGGGYRIFRWFLPFTDATMTEKPTLDNSAISFENYQGIFKKKTVGKTFLGLLLSILFLIVGVLVSILLVGKLNELLIILTITTLSLAASFVKGIRTLPKTFELGMFLIILFSILIASQFDASKLEAADLKLLLLIAFVIFTSTILHLLISKITKIPGDLFTIAHVALLYSPPFVAPVAAAMHNKKILVSGLVIGLVGWAVGNYLGIGLAEFLKLLPTASL